MTTERIIAVRGLEVMCRIGVPDEERYSPQRLLIDLSFAAVNQPADLGDDIDATVDYFTLTRRVIAIAGERPRRLIETLADETASLLLKEFNLGWVEISVRKFILRDAEWVSVSLRRAAD